MYESAFDDEISYYRSFFKTYNTQGKESAYQLIFDKKCSRKNTDENLKVALNDIFIKKISKGTVIKSTAYHVRPFIDRLSQLTMN